MKKAMLSQPMNGLTDDEIVAVRNRAVKYLEENGFEIISAEFERIPNDLKEVTEEQRVTLDKLLEKFEEDEDVQNVFHNIKETEE